MLYAELRKSGTLRVVGYAPIEKKEMLLPPPLFKGRSKWGDIITKTWKR